MTIQAFGMIEKAVQYVLEHGYAPATGHTGGDLSYNGIDDLYVWIGLIPGSGYADQTEGEWTLDIDCFGKNYASTMRSALEIEAFLLPGMHRSPEMNLDSVTCNGTPSEVPWEDDGVYRISATYTFTARRSG